MKVELGAGRNAAPGYLTVDLNPEMHPDYVASALELPFDTGTVTALRAIDVLEHISYRDTAAALEEWARVLVTGGTLYVQVPDAESIMWWFVETPAKLTTPPDLPQTAIAGAAWRLLGGHADGEYVDADGDWRWNAHFALFTRVSLTDALTDAGFEVEELKVNRHPNICAWARRL